MLVNIAMAGGHIKFCGIVHNYVLALHTRPRFLVLHAKEQRKPGIRSHVMIT